MKPDLLIPSDDTLYIDNTMLQAWTSCPRSFEYAWVYRRKLAEQRPALNFGSAIHAALDVRYKQGNGEVTSTVEQLQGEALHKWFETNPQPSEDFRNENTAAALIDSYNVFYKVEPFEVVHTESAFAEPFADFVLKDGRVIHVVWMGRVDLVLKMQMNGLIWNMDHKTSSVLGPGFPNDYILSQPQVGYVWAARRRGIDVHGYIVNVLAVRKMSSKKTADENFMRFHFPVDEDRMLDWYNNTCVNIQELLNHYQSDFFPMRTEQHCNGKYGRCPFLHVCTNPRENRGVTLMSNLYQHNDWSPLEGRDE